VRRVSARSTSARVQVRVERQSIAKIADTWSTEYVARRVLDSAAASELESNLAESYATDLYRAVLYLRWWVAHNNT
jgi:hypothetical protein